jgi:hypothetical protein
MKKLYLLILATAVAAFLAQTLSHRSDHRGDIIVAQIGGGGR